MGALTLEKKIKQLPENLKLKVEGYIDALISEEHIVLNTEVKKERQFGGLKGAFGELPEDFDEPLEDFKDYM